MSRVRDLSEHIMLNPQHLVIFPNRAAEIADQLKGRDIELPSWDFPPFYPQTDDFEDMCLYYLIFNSINYCYFDEYGNVFQDGDHRSSTLAGLRITENFEELKDPTFLSNVDSNYMLGDLFKADTPISLVKDRVSAFREIGNFLLRNPDFTFKKMFARTHGNAYFASQQIPTFFPSWSDPFFKRAQLFIGMVQGRFNHFDAGLEDLTVFADYRVPQTLHAMGMLRYNFELFNTISSNDLIPYGSRQELEIRAATIVLTDTLLDKLNEHHSGSLNALHIDYLLWSAMRKRDTLPPGVIAHSHTTPHHRTMTTDY